MSESIHKKSMEGEGGKGIARKEDRMKHLINLSNYM